MPSKIIRNIFSGREKKPQTESILAPLLADGQNIRLVVSTIHDKKPK